MNMSKGSGQYQQKSVTRPCPESDKSILYPQTQFLQNYFNISLTTYYYYYYYYHALLTSCLNIFIINKTKHRERQVYKIIFVIIINSIAMKHC